MARDSFIFYRSFYESIKELDLEKQTEIYNAIFSFQFDDVEIKLKGISKSIFALILPLLKANNTRYNNGCKGGAPKGNNNAKKYYKNNLETTKKQPKNNVMNNVLCIMNNENENERESNKVASHFPTLANILDYSNEIGVNDEEYCESFFNHYESIGWVNGTGQEIKNWKLVFNNWCKKDNKMKTNKKEEYDTRTFFQDDKGVYKYDREGVKHYV